MKRSRIRKLTWRVLLLYAVAVGLISLADPDPDKVRSGSFWIGIGLLCGGEAIRLWASGHLVKNQVLTTTGPYAHVKNPLYIGTFLCMVGFCVLAKGNPELSPWYLRHLNWLALGAGVAIFFGYYVPRKKRREADRLRGRFGEAWDHYDRNVPDYIPKWRRYERAPRAAWSWKAVCDNSEPWILPFLALGVAALVFNRAILAFAVTILPWG